MGKICTLHFDAKYCMFGQDRKKPLRKQIEFCRHLKCPHGTVSEITVNGEIVSIVSCDFTWNAFDNRDTTSEEREEMNLCS